MKVLLEVREIVADRQAICTIWQSICTLLSSYFCFEVLAHQTRSDTYNFEVPKVVFGQWSNNLSVTVPQRPQKSSSAIFHKMMCSMQKLVLNVSEKREYTELLS